MHPTTGLRMYPPVRQLDGDRLYASPRRRADRRGRRRRRLALLTWAAAYTVITLVLEAIGPVIASWPLRSGRSPSAR